MSNGGEPPAAPGLKLDFLAENLPFLTRALRAFIRVENAEFFRALQAEQGEIATLALIGVNPGISQNDLAQTLVLKKSAITRLIKALEERGLVLREKGANDRRFNALTLTADGEAKYRQLREVMAEQHRVLLGVFSEAEQTQLFGLLNRLHAHLADRHAARVGSDAAAEGLPDD